MPFHIKITFKRHSITVLNLQIDLLFYINTLKSSKYIKKTLIQCFLI